MTLRSLAGQQLCPSSNVCEHGTRRRQWLHLALCACLLLLPVAGFAQGTVVAWGLELDGQATVPVDANDAIAIGAGHLHSLVVRTDGTVAAFGANAFGQRDVPAGLTGVTAVAGGLGHSLALKSDGTVVAWGNDSSGQASVPAGLAGVTAIAAGLNHSLALRSDGTVAGWAMTAPARRRHRLACRASPRLPRGASIAWRASQMARWWPGATTSMAKSMSRPG